MRSGGHLRAAVHPPDPGLVELHGGGPHRDRAGVADGLGRVDDKVHQHLPDLARVARRLGQVLAELRTDDHAGRYRHVQELDRVLDGGIHVHPLKRSGLLPGVGEHLARQLRSAARRGLYPPEALPHG